MAEVGGSMVKSQVCPWMPQELTGVTSAVCIRIVDESVQEHGIPLDSP